MKPHILALAVALCSLRAGATEYVINPGTPDVFGSVDTVTTVYEDTLVDIARRNSLGYEEIVRVNPTVNPWLPGEGTKVILPNRRILPPGPHEGIVVNIPEHRLYYYPKPKKGEPQKVLTFPVSIGKMDWRTPLGRTTIVAKQTRPYWYPPESVRKEHKANGEPLPSVVPPGPDNPLGEYAMRMGIRPGTYLIHGTNNPLAVGMAVTHGCIRMYPEDIATLFPMIKTGTPVWLINEPVKVAYVDGELLLEVHPQVDSQGQSMEPDLDLLSKKLDEALGPTPAAIHWDIALETLRLAAGTPVVVGLQADLDPATPDPAASDPEAAAPSAPPTAAATP
jgi:L,D-transpeptidase ErfK/SrfK